MKILNEVITQHNSEYYKYKVTFGIDGFINIFSIKINSLSEKDKAIKKAYEMAIKCKIEKEEKELIANFKKHYLNKYKHFKIKDLSAIELKCRDNILNNNIETIKQLEYSGEYQAVRTLKIKVDKIPF